jgi:hypothetical protein
MADQTVTPSEQPFSAQPEAAGIGFVAMPPVGPEVHLTLRTDRNTLPHEHLHH